MKHILLYALLTTALFCGSPGNLVAADFDVSTDADLIPPDSDTYSDIRLWSADGTVHNAQEDRSITLKTMGDTLTIGKSSGNAGKGFALEMDKITSTLAPTTMNIVAAAEGGGPNGADVTVSLNLLDFSNGEINLRGDASGRAALIIENLSLGPTKITVEGNSLFAVTAATLPLDAELNLKGGDASFAGAVKFTKGLVTASADSRLAAGGGLTFNRSNSSPEEAGIRIADGATLTILDSLDNGSKYGNLTLGDAGNWVSYISTQDAGAVLDMQGTGTLRAGILNLLDGAAFSTNAPQSGTVHVESLKVDNNALQGFPYEGKAFIDTGDVDTVVEGDTTIGEYAQYTVAGTGNVYKGAVTVKGLLDNAGTTAIRLGAGGELGVMVIDGGSVASGTSHTFDINNADIRIVQGGAGAALDAAIGKLDLSTSNIFASAATAAINTTGGVAAKSYTQTAGITTVDGGGERLVVLEKAVIGGAGASATFRTGSDSTVFQGGLRLAENGVLAASTASAVIGLGTASLAADMELAGGAALDAVAGMLTFVDKSGTGTAQVRVTNSANTIQGAVELSGFSITVVSGGVLSASGTASSLASTTTGNFVHVESGGTLSAAANISVNGFDKVIIDGTYAVGDLSGALTRMTVDTEAVFGAGAAIAMTGELAKTVAVGEKVLVTGAGVQLGGATSWTSMFGSFEYAVSGKDVMIARITNRITGATDADRLMARENLHAMWGAGQIGPGLADIVFGATVSNTITNPSNGAAGDKNLDIFDAIANPTGKNIGRDTIEYINGAHLYGVTDVAIETNHAFFSDVAARAKVVHGQFVAARESLGSEDALASTAMNASLANRVWASGFGLWQDAGERDGFSGYKYRSGGVILGYDRAVGQGVVLGASTAYTKGDYKDKGALAHDSDIESWSGGLYGIYSTCAGFFATLHGGYTYSDNSLRELRRDPSTGTTAWARADFHTSTWSAGGNAGWDFRLSKCLTLTPAVGLTYIRARNGNHNSWLNGVATQRVHSAGNSGLFLPLEATAQYDLAVGDTAKVRFEAGAGYAYNFEKDGLDGSITYFDLIGPGGAVTSKIRSRDNARHSYKLGGGLRYQQGAFDMGLRYDYMGKSDYDAHRLTGTVGLAF